MKAIVVTTINAPTDAVKALAHLNEYELIVVGDLKTPKLWELAGARFIPYIDGDLSQGSLARVLPSNHYSRKMLGYQEAISTDADFIIDTDDDNFPKSDYGFPDFLGDYERINPDCGFVNPYALFTHEKIWPRGLPLDQILRDDSRLPLETQSCKVGVWQGLADGDPDVDAIYRLTGNNPCEFRERNPVVLGSGTIAPFNSQNTMFRKELFPLLYLPATVTFRFTDILRGLVAQPIMWSLGFELGFTRASVVQVRNPHDYFQDFISEIPMYQFSRTIPQVVSQAINPSADVLSNLWSAYKALIDQGIVPFAELKILQLWLDSFTN